jgi:hypothetical protein
VQKYESGVRVTDLANVYSMSKSTISTITHILQSFFIIMKTVLWEVRNALWVFALFVMGKNSLELRPT